MRHGKQVWQQGFTLLEMMIVLAIIAILTTIAYPSYQHHIHAARRSEATMALLTAAQQLESYYSANGRYTLDKDGKTIAPVFSAQVPGSGAAYYQIASVGGVDSQHFTLQASRTGAMQGDDCGDFTLDDTGLMDIANLPAGSSKTAAACWRR